MSQHKEQQGFVTFAQNTAEVDYLELAYLQALNIKATQKNNRYAVIVDATTKEKVNDKHCNTFDYIIDIPNDYNDSTSLKSIEYQNLVGLLIEAIKELEEKLNGNIR